MEVHVDQNLFELPTLRAHLAEIALELWAVELLGLATHEAVCHDDGRVLVARHANDARTSGDHSREERRIGRRRREGWRAGRARTTLGRAPRCIPSAPPPAEAVAGHSRKVLLRIASVLCHSAPMYRRTVAALAAVALGAGATTADGAKRGLPARRRAAGSEGQDQR